ncbi:MAG: Sec-independent protein translocase protein TatB [Metallibacterium sp.]
MFGIDFNELLLIAVVALVVLGPEKLPGAARTAGALVRRARTAWASVQAEVAGELDKEALTQQWREGAAALRGMAREARATLGEARDTLQPALDAARSGLSSTELARSIGELRTLAARLDGEAGAERDALRAVAADVRAAADKLAAVPDASAVDSVAVNGAGAEAAVPPPPATQAVAQSLAEIAQRLQQWPAAAPAADTTAVAQDAAAAITADSHTPAPPHAPAA